MSKIKTKTTAENLETKFDAGEDVLDYFDVNRMTRPGHAKGGVNVDIPRAMILRIDRIAGRKGLARQAQIKEWLADKLKEEEKAVA